MKTLNLQEMENVQGGNCSGLEGYSVAIATTAFVISAFTGGIGLFLLAGAGYALAWGNWADDCTY